ncbi:MAG: class I SAM-dependent methyltransferase [Pseudanabaenaceae cyanobacterium]|jgi:SAM-dependent methyltransferase
MNSNSVSYNSDYFDSGIFETDYQSLALAIVNTYHPKTVAEFGCGPGYLTKELAKLGVQVTAIDGYSNPNFSEYSIEFHRLDLNDASAIEQLFAGKSFDVAISMEVVEHLQPQSSQAVVYWLTKVAPVAVFSAAVPGQGGHGHINLQPRDYWHVLFSNYDFLVADRIREKLRSIPTVAPWYRYNVLDYVHMNHPLAPHLTETINRLIASESAASSAYYEESAKLSATKAYLNYTPVKFYLWLRQLGKKLLRRV